MRALFFFITKYDITVVCNHIPGMDNGATGVLCRNDVVSFLQQVSDLFPYLLQLFLLRDIFKALLKFGWIGLNHCVVLLHKDYLFCIRNYFSHPS